MFYWGWASGRSHWHKIYHVFWVIKPKEHSRAWVNASVLYTGLYTMKTVDTADTVCYVLYVSFIQILTLRPILCICCSSCRLKGVYLSCKRPLYFCLVALNESSRADLLTSHHYRRALNWFTLYVCVVLTCSLINKWIKI